MYRDLTGVGAPVWMMAYPQECGQRHRVALRLE